MRLVSRSHWPRRLILMVWLAAAGTVVGRSAVLQVNNTEWRKRSAEQHQMSRPVPSVRGAILDRDGVRSLPKCTGEESNAGLAHIWADGDYSRRLVEWVREKPDTLWKWSPVRRNKRGFISCPAVGWWNAPWAGSTGTGD